jgi:hypothetical protein
MKVKLEAATAVIEPLMMGRETLETCWVVNKRQDNKLKIFSSVWWFIWIKCKTPVPKGWDLLEKIASYIQIGLRLGGQDWIYLDFDVGQGAGSCERSDGT